MQGATPKGELMDSAIIIGACSAVVGGLATVVTAKMKQRGEHDQILSALIRDLRGDVAELRAEVAAANQLVDQAQEAAREARSRVELLEQQLAAKIRHSEYLESEKAALQSQLKAYQEHHETACQGCDRRPKEEETDGTS